jgi:uncharacterized OB-fold protein
MATVKTRRPAVEGWFTMDEDAPHLVASRCCSCGTVWFPPAGGYCRNPVCEGSEPEEVRLSRTGRIWSYTDNRYQPPAPYVSPDPFRPYAIAAVELDEEKMVVLGQLAPDVDLASVSIGDSVELVLDTLYEDDESEYVVWKWRSRAR